jgi:hypothetical protein
VPLVEQELLTLPEHLSSPPVFSGVRVNRLFTIDFLSKKSLKIPKGGNQNPYIKKNRKHNGQKKKYKRTNNDLQNIHIKLKID